ncbi:hypothetical protein KDM41_15710 [bacterium]|nr:hypothetical protein [bacterium]
MRNERGQAAAVLILVGLGLCLVLAGCAGDEYRQAAGATGPAGQAEPGVDAAAGDGFGVDVVLCRKVGRKTGKRIGVGREFTMDDKARVQALVDFRGVRDGRTYTVHLVWIRPDGRELFRRYARATTRRQPDASWLTAVAWRDAEDLNHVRAETLMTDGPAFTLDSRLNIAPDREREVGDYLFRVYLDRRLLREEPFALLAAGPEGAAAEPASAD